MFDPNQEHIGGHSLKNQMIDGIRDGWCYLLDDDTILHKDLLASLDEVITPETRAVVVDQDLKHGQVRKAAKKSVRIGFIDAGQAIVRRDLIGLQRLPLVYEGDGYLLCAILPDEKNVIYLNKTLSYYNALR